MIGRNYGPEFARRTRKNLLRIERASADGEDVHPVSQIVVSLLGLVIVPWERKLPPELADQSIAVLTDAGWPKWTINMGTAATLGELLYHLRNAAAHGRFTFSSDDRLAEDVDITIEDYKPKATKPYWRATINAAALRAFCFRLVDAL